VAGIDALGFILGTAIAAKLNKGFIPIRKGGKLPCDVQSINFVDYSGLQKSLELRKGLLNSGEKVLIVDEWIETGTQMQSAIKLIEQEGGKIAGIATVNIDENPIPNQLRKKHKVSAAWLEMEPDAPNG
jgi:adenine phosphoribosyltransferase